jgi:branched-chain amino acid transport system ATP-binding protein
VKDGQPSMLNVKNLSVSFGKVCILSDVSLCIVEGEVVSVVGGNGAGKTTLLNTISRFVLQKSGTISFNEMCLDGVGYQSVVAMGLVQVPEGRMIFPSLTVLENLELGSYHEEAKKVRKESIAEIYRLFPILESRKRQSAGTLSGGEQQMLAIGRGLMSRPKLIMLDEPSLGLAPVLVQNMFNIIAEINRRKVTVLLVEQNVRKALRSSTRGYVLENGVVTMEGRGEDLLQNAHMKKAFLGL